MFGHCVRVFFKDAFDKHAKVLEEIGANPNNGLAAVLKKVEKKLPEDKSKEILADFEACYEDRPWLAMVNSDKGITNLVRWARCCAFHDGCELDNSFWPLLFPQHVPSDIIIDASMPVVIRDSGKMWNKLNELEDTKCLIPDRSYASIYQEMISYVKTKGQFDVA